MNILLVFFDILKLIYIHEWQCYNRLLEKENQ
jgi:hypothetical protein